MHGSAVQFDELPNDRQAKSKSGVTSRHRTIRLSQRSNTCGRNCGTGTVAGIEVPFRRVEPPNALREIAAGRVVTRLPAFGGEVLVVPSSVLILWRQRQLVALQ